MQLQIAPSLTLFSKKLISLGKKYFSIPPQDMPYYHEIPLTLRAQLDQMEENQLCVRNSIKWKRTKSRLRWHAKTNASI
jgi:hypothetical protein